MTGWICPRCGTCWAPTVQRCTCPAIGYVGGQPYVMTYPFGSCLHDYDYFGTVPSCRKCGAMAPPLTPVPSTVGE